LTSPHMFIRVNAV